MLNLRNGTETPDEPTRRSVRCRLLGYDDCRGVVAVVSKIHDPYAGCDKTCTHDLHRGILVADLKYDGPYPETSVLLGAGWLGERIAEAALRTTIRQATDSRIIT